VCLKATIGSAVRLGAATLACAFLISAQIRPDWRKIGSSSVDLNLASPATGPVDAVWFSADGAQLYARTRSGRIFETADFETWTTAVSVPNPASPPALTAARLPERSARLTATAVNPARMYALGRQLFRSDDGGSSWTDLTAYRSQSVIGESQHSLAVSPRDADQLVVANDYGVWRSMDGGLSWAGLNQFLPNLTVRRVVSLPSGLAGMRVEADGLGILELPPGGSVWLPAAAGLEGEAASRRQYSAALGADITAFGSSGQTVYAGSSDGRLWVSFDSGISWRPSPTGLTGAVGPVGRIFVDQSEPRVALVALAGEGAHVLRTTNSGIFWDNLTSNLPDVPARGVAGDRLASAVYVATDKGVFYARADLDNPGSAAVSWASISDQLPSAGATDVRLDAIGYQLYVALDGYGVYATPAPRRPPLRVVNAADYSLRAAAPGSLLSVIGGRVDSAQGGGLNYPVLAASDDESQIQVPFEAAGPNVPLALQTREGQVAVPLPVQPVSPAIFVGRDGAPMLLDADRGLMLGGGNAAHANSRIQILATGLGRVNPYWPAGVAAPLENPPAVAASIKAYLNGEQLAVTRATLAPGYIGFYLIETQLPAVVNFGASELYVTAGGQESNHVQLVVEP